MSTQTKKIAPSIAHGPEMQTIKALHSFLLKDFLAVIFPPQRFLLSPIILERGMTFLYAYRGVGKTLLALYIALAIASGKKIFHWVCDVPRAVLYIDGEMSAQALQERLSALCAGLGITPNETTLLRIITPDTQTRPMPNLASEEGQKLIEPHLKGISLVVLDNLSCLCSAGKENEAESWRPIQRWLLNLKRESISSLVVHHAGKGGDQRGTSAREDVMDTVVFLKNPSGHEPQEGARFEVHIKKSRNTAGEAIAPFEAKLKHEGNAFVWTQRDIVNPSFEEVMKFSGQGFSIREIEKKTGISRSSIHRILNLKK